MGPYHCLGGGQACQYAFPGIKLAFNGDHREVLEDWKNGSVVKLESHLKRSLLGMFSVDLSGAQSVFCQTCAGCDRVPTSSCIPAGQLQGPWRGQGAILAGPTLVPVRDPAARLRFGPVRLRGRFGVPCPPGPDVILSLSQINLATSRGQKIGRQPSGTPLIAFQVPFRIRSSFPYIDWVLGKQQGKRGVKRHCDIAENTRDLQPLVTNIVRLQSALGSASGPKAINMLIGTRASLRSVTIDENKLKVAENFTYLESSTNKGQMDNELDCRLGKASAAFNQLGFEAYYVEISQEKRKETGITGCFRY
ncbi:hypothetical protein Bbelb_374730 [Branchiostoma belcheri]|nr:hypothetical protein Bbelb_374730 [Branchiostoma belcheri]